MMGDKLWVGLVVGLCVASGCSDDSDRQTTATGGTGGTGTSSGGGEGGVGGGGGSTDTVTLTVVVKQWPGGDVIEGAGVAIDRAGDLRTQTMTDDQGMASFPAVDMANLVSVIAHKDGWTFDGGTAAYIADRFDSGNEPVELLLVESDPERVTLSGTAANTIDPGNQLVITTTALGDSINYSPVPDWSIRIAPDMPFTLVATEVHTGGNLDQGTAQAFVAWDVVESSAFSTDGTLAVDLGGTTQTNTVSGSFLKPTDESLATAGWSYILVTTYSTGDGLFLGATTSSEASQDDTAFDFTAEWIDVAGQDPVTTYMVRTLSPSGTVTKWSSVTVDGPPTGGSQDLGFHTPPEITMASFIDETMVWIPAPGETYDYQWLTVTADSALQGRFEMGAAETETRLPRVPSTSDASQIFQGSLRLSLGNCVGPRPSLECDKVSYVSRAVH